MDKHAVHNAQEARDKVTPHLQTVQKLYPRIVQKALGLGMKQENKAWATRKDFFVCMEKRAQFENRPLNAFYLHDIDAKVQAAVQLFVCTTESTGDEALYKSKEGLELCEALQRIVDDAVTDSVRNLDAMLFDSPLYVPEDDDAKPLENQSFVLQPRTIEDVHYYLEANLQGERKVHIEVPLEKFPSLDASSPAFSFDTQQVLDSINIARTDQIGGNAQPVCSIAPSHFSGRQVLHVTFAAQPYAYGDLRGSVQVGEDVLDLDKGSSRYLYAVPDQAEFNKILSMHGITADPNKLLEQSNLILEKFQELRNAAAEVMNADSAGEPGNHASMLFTPVLFMPTVYIQLNEMRKKAEQAFQNLLPAGSTLSPNDVLNSRELQDLIGQLTSVRDDLKKWLRRLPDRDNAPSELDQIDQKNFNSLRNRSVKLLARLQELSFEPL